MDTTSIYATAERSQIAGLGRYWKWLAVTGVLAVIIGIFSMATPIHTTIGLTYTIATLLLVCGGILLVQAIATRKEHGSVMRFMHAFLALIVGGLIFRYPQLGILGITLALAFYFFIASAIEGFFATSIRPHRGWVGEMVNAIIYFALGVCIVLTFPMSALWIPGFILGVSFISLGASMFMLSSAVHKSYNNLNQFGGDKNKHNKKQPPFKPSSAST